MALDMKNVSFYLILLSVVASSCLSQRDFIAEYDYSYRGNFKRYQTFGFVEETGRDPSSSQPVIEKTIVSRLASQGFRLKDKNPDMLITYKLFSAATSQNQAARSPGILQDRKKACK